MITIHKHIIQGTDEWLQIRRGMLTASAIKNVITPSKLQFSKADKAKQHVYQVVADRVTDFVEEGYTNDDMMRGHFDEVIARQIYNDEYDEVDEVGFITNTDLGFPVGCSPDGLVGDDGMIEIKSRKAKYQVQTVLAGGIPKDYMLQVQTALMVSGRSWCDFISYCGGMPLYVYRVEPDNEIIDAIATAAEEFEEMVTDLVGQYTLKSAGLIKTERIEEEMQFHE